MLNRLKILTLIITAVILLGVYYSYIVIHNEKKIINQVPEGISLPVIPHPDAVRRYEQYKDLKVIIKKDGSVYISGKKRNDKQVYLHFQEEKRSSWDAERKLPQRKVVILADKDTETGHVLTVIALAYANRLKIHFAGVESAAAPFFVVFKPELDIEEFPVSENDEPVPNHQIKLLAEDSFTLNGTPYKSIADMVEDLKKETHNSIALFPDSKLRWELTAKGFTEVYAATGIMPYLSVEVDDNLSGD
ncbi:MAG: ExbD/TolR family protein [Planctomycetota bacterium]|jgi:biopolymer transport protein ExbD